MIKEELEPRSRISFLDEIAQRFGDCDFKEFQILYDHDAVFQLVYHAMTKYASHHRRFMTQKNGDEVDVLKERVKDLEDFVRNFYGANFKDGEAIDEAKKLLIG